MKLKALGGELIRPGFTRICKRFSTTFLEGWEIRGLGLDVQLIGIGIPKSRPWAWACPEPIVSRTPVA